LAEYANTLIKFGIFGFDSTGSKTPCICGCSGQRKLID